MSRARLSFICVIQRNRAGSGYELAFAPITSFGDDGSSAVALRSFAARGVAWDRRPPRSPTQGAARSRRRLLHPPEGIKGKRAVAWRLVGVVPQRAQARARERAGDSRASIRSARRRAASLALRRGFNDDALITGSRRGRPRQTQRHHHVAWTRSGAARKRRCDDRARRCVLAAAGRARARRRHLHLRNNEFEIDACSNRPANRRVRPRCAWPDARIGWSARSRAVEERAPASAARLAQPHDLDRAGSCFAGTLAEMHSPATPVLHVDRREGRQQAAAAWR